MIPTTFLGVSGAAAAALVMTCSSASALDELTSCSRVATRAQNNTNPCHDLASRTSSVFNIASTESQQVFSSVGRCRKVAVCVVHQVSAESAEHLPMFVCRSSHSSSMFSDRERSFTHTGPQSGSSPRNVRKHTCSRSLSACSTLVVHWTHMVFK